MTMNTLTHTGTHPGKLLASFALAITLPYNQTGYAAPVAPDAGQTQRELQQQPVPKAPKVEPQLHIEQQLNFEKRSDDSNKTSDRTDGTRFMIKAINISGNSEIPAAELQALVANLLGAEHTLAELSGAAARLTAYYRARGYAVARAYLPEQEINNGEVSIKIIEGHIAKHQIDNRSRLSDKRVNDYLSRIKTDTVIKTAQIDRALRLLNDIPGVESVRATLQPGSSVGTSDLAVELKPASLYSGNISLDNYGNRYIGEYRLGGTLNLNSPFKIGDQLRLTALASNQKLNSGRIIYQVPIGNDGLRLGGTYTNIRYHLGKEFSVMNTHGTVSSVSAFAAYPYMLGQNTNLIGMINGEQKTLSDDVALTGSAIRKYIRVVNLGLSGNHMDALFGGGNSNAAVLLAMGKLSIDSPSALAFDDSSARTNGTYGRLSFSADRLQHITDADQFLMALSGQRASKNLDSSEKFSLGGATGVRAYPQGEGIGDHGYLATLELRHNLVESIQGTLFYDIGSVTINHTPYLASASNTQTLSGLGIGINTDVAGTQFKASVAWRTSGGPPATIPAGAVHTPTFWLWATEQF